MRDEGWSDNKREKRGPGRRADNITPCPDLKTALGMLAALVARTKQVGRSFHLAPPYFTTPAPPSCALETRSMDALVGLVCESESGVYSLVLVCGVVLSAGMPGGAADGWCCF